MSQKRLNFHCSFIFVSFLAGARHVPTPSDVDEQLCTYLSNCLDAGAAGCENRFPVNTLALASGGWDVTKRDGTGRKGSGLDGKGRDKERDRTGWRGTRHDREARGG